MIKWILISLAVVASADLQAQGSLEFRSQNYIGLLEGDNGSAFQFNTINGVQKGTWFAGLGTGFDWYLYRSVPLFLSVNKDWKPSNRTFFFSVDGGVNFPWIKDEPQRTPWDDFITDEFKAGYFWGAGLGYKAGFKNKKDALVLNLGYSFKQLKEERTVPMPCISPPCPTSTDRYNYKTNRVSVRLGWQF